MDATPEVQLFDIVPPEPLSETESPYVGEVIEKVPPVVGNITTVTLDVLTITASATELVAMVSVVAGDASETGVPTL